MNCKISIITPTFNRAHLLARAIESVITQTYKDWELLIMDDGSTDDTESVVQNYKEDKIRFYKSKNIGAGAQRNRGVEKAHGDFIIFLDSDDWVEPNWLESINNRITNKKLTIVTCASRTVNEAGETIGTRKPKDLGKFFDNIELNFLAGSLLIPKFLFQESGGYDITLPAGQHTDLLIRLVPLIRKHKLLIEKIDEPLVNIYNHSGIKIRENFDVVFLANKMIMKKHRDLFKKVPSKHFDFLSVTAVAAFKSGRPKEGKELTMKALKINPFSYLAHIRFIISRIPTLQKKIWLQK